MDRSESLVRPMLRCSQRSAVWPPAVEAVALRGCETPNLGRAHFDPAGVGRVCRFALDAVDLQINVDCHKCPQESMNGMAIMVIEVIEGLRCVRLTRIRPAHHACCVEFPANFGGLEGFGACQSRRGATVPKGGMAKRQWRHLRFGGCWRPSLPIPRILGQEQDFRRDDIRRRQPVESERCEQMSILP